mmetsp:Transcript_2494/g.5941  ORF Transcript_2494/g.5941 Transcript_2494/m.5941 type:complete len:304 (+) Transcript_2494:34-945(+)
MMELGVGISAGAVACLGHGKGPFLHRSPCRAQTRSKTGQLTVLGQLALLIRLVSRRFHFRGTRPRGLWPRRSRRAFRADLRERGAAVARVPLKACSELLSVAQVALGDQSTTPKLFSRAGGLNVAFPETMSWHWAASADALELFSGAAKSVLKQLGGDWGLVAASFVVAEGDCVDSAARFHVDFGPPPIPRNAAATALLPLHPAKFPTEEGNLELMPWDAANEPCVYHYAPGQAIVFDGKLAHRTQPFSADAFQRESEAAEPLRGRRILASMSFARVAGQAPWQRAVNQVISGYGAPVLKPIR